MATDWEFFRAGVILKRAVTVSRVEIGPGEVGLLYGDLVLSGAGAEVVLAGDGELVLRGVA